MLTEAEAEAQRAEYLEHVAMNKNMASEITGRVSPNADENSAIVSAPTVPTLSPTAVSPTPTAVSMPKPAIVSIVASGSKYPTQMQWHEALYLK
jgi:hypothetical protein